MTNQKSQDNTPQDSLQDYIRKMERESWYLEMITSGVALFFVFQVPGLLNDFRYFVAYVGADVFTYTLQGIPIVLDNTSYIIIGLLIFHLIMRAFWIGVIGLNSVFQEGIQYEKLGYSPFFLKKLKKALPEPKRWIQYLDDLSSTIYGFAFFILLLMLGVAVYVVVSLLVSFGIISLDGIIYKLTGALLLILFFLLGLLSIIDFVTSGLLLKRNETISKIYYPIYKFVGFLSLSFLYRPIYYMLVSNLSKGKVILLLGGLVVFLFASVNTTFVYVPFFPKARPFSGFGIKGADTSAMVFNFDYYENRDNTGEQLPNQPRINKDVFNSDESYLRLFIPYSGVRISSVKEFCRHKGYKIPVERGLRQKYFVIDNGDFNIAGTVLDISAFEGSWQCLNEMWNIYIDDSIHLDNTFQFTKHPNTHRHGLINYIPLDTLSDGRHHLRINRKDVGKDSTGASTITEDVAYKIPFWVK